VKVLQTDNPANSRVFDLKTQSGFVNIPPNTEIAGIPSGKQLQLQYSLDGTNYMPATGATNPITVGSAAGGAGTLDPTGWTIVYNPQKVSAGGKEYTISCTITRVGQPLSKGTNYYFYLACKANNELLDCSTTGTDLRIDNYGNAPENCDVQGYFNDPDGVIDDDDFKITGAIDVNSKKITLSILTL